MFWLLKKIHDYRFKRALSAAYYGLARLQKSFFDGFLNQETLVKQYKQLYPQQAHFLRAFKRLYDLVKHDERARSDLIKLECLHEVVCSLHLLRFRFTEFSSFEMCEQEMRSLQKTSTLVLLKMARRRDAKIINKAIDDFLSSIYMFEGIYNNTLYIVARDPIIFQFFIQDLYALHTLMVEAA